MTDEPAAYLMVCLCDLQASDVITHLYVAGRGQLPANLCEQHKTAKLESLMMTNCALSFAHFEPNGDFAPMTLAAAIEKISATNPVAP